MKDYFELVGELLERTWQFLTRRPGKLIAGSLVVVWLAFPKQVNSVVLGFVDRVVNQAIVPLVVGFWSLLFWPALVLSAVLIAAFVALRLWRKYQLGCDDYDED